MRLGVFLFPIFLLFGVLPAHASLELNGQFCLQTFNVYATAYAPAVSPRLERLAKAMLAEPCEVTQLQELWRSSDFEHVKKSLEPGHTTLIFADQLRHDSSMIGLASAYQGAILNSYSELFRVNNERGALDFGRNLLGVQKGFTAIETRLEQSPEAFFLNLHTHPTDQPIRAAQILQLIDFALFHSEKVSHLPLILTGDLNATPESLESRLLRNVLLLRDGFSEANHGYGDKCTYCGNNRYSWSKENRVIDYTLFRSSLDVELSAAQSNINLTGEKDNPLSDHYGVRTFLAWKIRDRNPLQPSDEIVLARKRLAIATLTEARNILAKDPKEAVRAMSRLADEIITKLSGALPESVDLMFRLN
jgi:endonuclease/exonuclease/phosphatase family metal-dependent hydrolase